MKSFKKSLLFLALIIFQVNGFSQEFNIKWAEEQNLKDDPFSEIIGSTDSVFYTIYKGSSEDDYSDMVKEEDVVISKYRVSDFKLISKQHLSREREKRGETISIYYAASILNNREEIIIFYYSFNSDSTSFYTQKITASGEALPIRLVHQASTINSDYWLPKVIINEKKQSEVSLILRGREYTRAADSANANVVVVTFNQSGALVNSNSFDTQISARFFSELDTKADSAGNIYIAGYTLYRPGSGHSISERITQVFQDVQILKLPYQQSKKILNIINISIKNTFQNEIVIKPDFNKNELLVAAFVGEDSLKTPSNTRLLVRKLNQETLDVIYEESIPIVRSSFKNLPESIFYRGLKGIPVIYINKITRDKQGMPVIIARSGGSKSALTPNGYQGNSEGIFIFNFAKSEVKMALFYSSVSDDFGHYLGLENNHNYVFLASCHTELKKHMQTGKYRYPRSKYMAMGYFEALDSQEPTFHLVPNAIPDKKYLVLMRSHFVNDRTAIILARKGKKYQFGLLVSKKYSFMNLEKPDKFRIGY